MVAHPEGKSHEHLKQRGRVNIGLARSDGKTVENSSKLAEGDILLRGLILRF